MRRSPTLVVFAVIACLALVISAADWPQWRGPNRDGVSKETGLLKEWPSAGPKLMWQVKDLGGGFSTPAIVGNRLYVMSTKGTEHELVKVLSTENGKEIWSVNIGGIGPNTKGNNYPGA